MNCLSNSIYKKNSFLFFNSKEKYKESQRTCEKHNATLLPLKNKETMRKVSQLLKSKDCPSKWRIGLNFDRETKKGRYSDNTLFYPQYHINIVSLFEQNERETKCQSTFIDRDKKTLFRYKCNENLPFICFNPRLKNKVMSKLGYTEKNFDENNYSSVQNKSKNETKHLFTQAVKNVKQNFLLVGKSRDVTVKPILFATFSGVTLFGCFMLLFLIMFLYKKRKNKKGNISNKNVYFSYNTSQNGQSYEETEVRLENSSTKMNKEKSTKITAI